MEKNLKRLTVLDYSLDLEWLASKQLSRLLMIDNHKDSISFGETSQSLTINQKINLLLDSQDINIDDKPFFKAFMEIRNKFVHNRDINTYKEACESTEKIKFIKKHFGGNANDSNDEIFLEDAVSQLFKKCSISLIELKGQTIENEGVIKRNERNKKDLDFTSMQIESIRDGFKESFEIITNNLETDKKYSSNEILNLFEEFKKHINLYMLNTGMSHIKDKTKKHS